jgi:predicted dehydrogenase
MSVKVGIIGCGAIGQRRHIPEAAANPNVQIVALCDINLERAKSVAKQYGDPQVFGDYKQMLKSADIEAVVVGTPNYLHASMTIDALNAGKHVLVEKPMATTREDAKAMIKAAAKAKKFLMVGQNQRLMPPHVRAKQIMDSGRLGKPLTFQTTFKHPGPDGWSVDGAKSWFFKKEMAVLGVTGDLGVHKADLMRYLLADEIVQVEGIIATQDKKDSKGKLIPLDDNALMVMKTRRGVVGVMTISWTNYGRFEDNSTVIYCEKGVLSMGTDPQFGVIVNYSDGTSERHQLGAIASNARQTNSGVMDMFIKGIMSNKQPPIDGSEGYKSLDVILTAMDAAKAGKALKVNGL